MSKTFEERVEEVLGELHGMAWPLLDESQKRKIVGKVVRGIDRYDDTYVAWGRALGCEQSTIRKRCDRFRRSEPIDGGSIPDRSPQLRYEVQKASEEELAAAFDDPKTARKLARAAAQHEAKVETEVRRETRERAPDLADRAAFNEAAGDLLRAIRAGRKSLEIARESRFRKDERDALLDDVLKLANVATFYETFLTGGSVDWDEALSELEG